MASATVQINVRIGIDLKRAGDEVFAHFGLNPSEVVRSVWAYAAQRREPPAFMVTTSDSEASRRRAHKITLIERGAGLALRVVAGQDVALPLQASAADWGAECRALRDAAYDDMIAGALRELAEAGGVVIAPAGEGGGSSGGHDA